ILKRHGGRISRTTMANWIIRLDDVFKPLICRVPCDYIPKRSYPLFRTRQILNDWLTQNLEEA
ncbi:hypothetical protein, partial [Thiolapillus sp.]